MRHRFFGWALFLSLTVLVTLVFAHEMTGWIAPVEARKVKNPIKATQASIQKGKEIYEKKCALCHGIKGDGNGPASVGLNPKPARFKGPHGHGGQISDGEHFWKITTGKGGMPSFSKDLTEEERWNVINYFNTFMKHK